MGKHNYRYKVEVTLQFPLSVEISVGDAATSNEEADEATDRLLEKKLEEIIDEAAEGIRDALLFDGPRREEIRDDWDIEDVDVEHLWGQGCHEE